MSSWRYGAGRVPKIGVLAIQGDFLEHRHVLARLGVDAPEIRLPSELDGLDGLIIPGGESTTIVQLIDIYGFRSVLAEKVGDGLPVWGTCAGMIVLADSLTDRRPEPLHLMDIDVSRNAFGSQVDSFEGGPGDRARGRAALSVRIHQGACSQQGRRGRTGTRRAARRQARRRPAGLSDGHRLPSGAYQRRSVHDLFRRIVEGSA